MARKWSGPKRLVSRWSAACSRCGGWMPAGSAVEWEAGKKAWHAESCPAVPAPRPAIEFRSVEPVVEAGKAAATALPGLRTAASAAEAVWVAAVRAAGGCATCEGTGKVSCGPCHGSGSVRVMSDVWDGCDVCHGSGVVTCVPCGATGRPPVEVSLVPEVAAAFTAWRVARDRVSEAEGAVSHGSSVRTNVRRGVHVRVFKGRKVPVGTVGVVIWIGSGNFGPRVGVKDAAGTVHWTAESNVEVVAVPVEVPAGPAAVAA